MNGDREISIFRIQLTSSKIGGLTRLILTLAICVTIQKLLYLAEFLGRISVGDDKSGIKKNAIMLLQIDALKTLSN